VKIDKKVGLTILIVCFVLGCFLPLAANVPESGMNVGRDERITDHFDGARYFNPDLPQALPSMTGQAARWVWNWIFRIDRPKWPKNTEFMPGAPPIVRAPEGSLYVTPVGHGTFLIQLDGLNILTDPIWSERCSPVSWVGPKRKLDPGIRFEDLPPIDVVLVSHNHYDHLDLPTLERLAGMGMPRAIVPLGNRDLILSAGIPIVDELDWWRSVSLSPDVTITLVPAQHYSSRSLWDRNRSLWGGFVISGPSGHVFYSGDTGYGPHFQEIGRRFSPIRVALLPIGPFKEPRSGESGRGYRRLVHMGPAEAVKAHLDLGSLLSIAAHFQVFQLGLDGYSDAADMLAWSLKEQNLRADSFIAPLFGQAIDIPPVMDVSQSVAREDYCIEWAGGNSCPSQGELGENSILLPGVMHVEPRVAYESVPRRAGPQYQ